MGFGCCLIALALTVVKSQQHAPDSHWQSLFPSADSYYFDSISATPHSKWPISNPKSAGEYFSIHADRGNHYTYAPFGGYLYPNQSPNRPPFFTGTFPPNRVPFNRPMHYEPIPMYLEEVTVAEVVTSTIGVTSVIHCVPSSQLEATTKCSSKRAASVDALTENDDKSPVSPTTVEEMEITPRPTFLDSANNAEAEVTDLHATADTLQGGPSVTNDREKRFFWPLSTIYSIVTVLTTQTVSAMVRGRSLHIGCLPDGFVMCRP